MPNICDDTLLFAQEANKRFTNIQPLGSSLFQNQPDANQTARIRQLEADNANLRHNLKSLQARLDSVLTENSDLKEKLEDQMELSKLSPVKASAVNEKDLIKPYLNELEDLRAKLKAYEDSDPEATRIVRYTKNNPYDKAMKKREAGDKRPSWK